MNALVDDSAGDPVSPAPTRTIVSVDSRVLSRLVHELRNPLAPIRMAMQIMQMSESDVATARAARVIIDRQLKQLTQLIDSLADVTQLESGRLQLKQELVALDSISRMALELARPQLESRQNVLDIENATDTTATVFVDSERVAVAVANVLNNASKYSPLGSRIRLATRVTADEVIVSVVDTGIGIPETMLSRIFDPFVAIDRTGGGTHDGLGIGLALARNVAQLHGGQLEARSAGEGRGSEFIFTFPRAQGSTQPFSRVLNGAPLDAHKLRILVADDNRDAAQTLAIMLAFDGHEVRTAHDGFEALAIGQLFTPDLVLLDIGMPVLDGYQTATQIRERDWGRDLYLVALTGWGQETDRRAALRAGFQDHVVKPASQDRLSAVIDAAKRTARRGEI